MRAYRVVCDGCGRRWPHAPTRAEARTVAARDGRHRCGDRPAVRAARLDPAIDPEGVAHRIAHARALDARRRYRLHPIRWDDVLSDAMLGATYALNRYDPARFPDAASFVAYVSLRVDGTIIDGLRDRGVVSRKAYAAGVRESDLPAWRQGAVSIDSASDDGGSLAYVVADPVDDIARTEARLDVEAALAHLASIGHARLADVVRWHHLDGVTLAAIAARLGVTESRVCQMNADALRRLTAWAAGEPTSRRRRPRRDDAAAPAA